MLISEWFRASLNKVGPLGTGTSCYLPKKRTTAVYVSVCRLSTADCRAVDECRPDGLIKIGMAQAIGGGSHCPK